LTTSYCLFVLQSFSCDFAKFRNQDLSEWI